jgi:hypothetical protein
MKNMKGNEMESSINREKAITIIKGLSGDTETEWRNLKNTPLMYVLKYEMDVLMQALAEEDKRRSSAQQ